MKKCGYCQKKFKTLSKIGLCHDCQKMFDDGEIAMREKTAQNKSNCVFSKIFKEYRNMKKTYVIIMLIILGIFFIWILLGIVFSIINQEMSHSLEQGIIGFFTAAILNIPFLLMDRQKNIERKESQKNEEISKNAEDLQNKIFNSYQKSAPIKGNATCIFCGRRVAYVNEDDLCETCANLINKD